MGPVLMDVPGSSVSFMKKILEGGMPMTPRMMLSWVDIRDVSEAHLKCLTDRSLESNCFILSEDRGRWFMDYCDILRDEFRAYPVPSRTVWNWALRFLAKFDADADMALPYLGKSFSLSN